MALNRDFRIKDSLNVGVSALFRAESSQYDPTKVAIDTYGSILSGGRDIANLFSTAASDVPKYNSVYTTVNTSSSYWDSAYTTVNTNSGDWDNTLGESAYTTTNANSANWDTAYTTVNAKESKWDSSYTTTNANSANWDTAYTTVNTKESNWDTAYTVVNAKESKWDSSYTTTNVNSANWDTAYTAINTKESKWDSSYTTTNANSANWDTAYTTVNTKESNWDTAYNAINAKESKWDSSYTTTNANSANWDNTYTTVSNNSASWDNTLGESVYTSYNSASATTINSVAEGNAQGKVAVTSLNGTVTQVDVNNLQTEDSPTFANVHAGSINIGTNVANDNIIDTTVGDLIINSSGGTTTIDDELIVAGDTTVQGSLSVIGDFTYIDTTVSVTSALEITNAGTGPALVVNQTGAQPVVDFQDDGETTLYVEDGGNVGIGTSDPSTKLTVAGTVSAQGDTTIDGSVTINSNINQYSAPGGTDYINNQVFTSDLLLASPTTVNTFIKSGLKSIKYIVSMYSAGSRTAFEIITTYNGTDVFGSVYGQVDAQATSLLSDVDISSTGSTIDLEFTVSADCSVTIYGIAHY